MALGILELVCTVRLIFPAADGPGDREPRVRLGARQVRRDDDHHLERHAGPSSLLTHFGLADNTTYFGTINRWASLCPASQGTLPTLSVDC